MPMLKTASWHNNGTGWERYLTQENWEQTGSRAIDIFDEDNYNMVPPFGWAEQMNETREIFGHNLPTNRGPARTFYTQVIRPDHTSGNPADQSLELLQDLVRTYCKTHFADYEYAIIFHRNEQKETYTDETGHKNERVIGWQPGYHAHITWNSTNMATEAKYHVGIKELRQQWVDVQALAFKAGMSILPSGDEETIKEAIERAELTEQQGQAFQVAIDLSKAALDKTRPYLSRAELHNYEIGQVGWKVELRARIMHEVKRSGSFGQFQHRLRGHDFDVYPTPQGLIFVTPEGHRCRSSRLGGTFEPDYLERFYTDTTLIELRQSKESLPEKMPVYLRYAPRAYLQHEHEAIRVMRQESITEETDFKGRIDECAGRGREQAARLKKLAATLEIQNIVMAAARDVEETHDTYSQLATHSGRALIKYQREHADELVRYAHGRDILQANGADPDNTDPLYDDYNKLAGDYEQVREQVDKTAERLMRLQNAQKVVFGVVRAAAEAEDMQRRRTGRPAFSRRDRGAYHLSEAVFLRAGQNYAQTSIGLRKDTREKFRRAEAEMREILDRAPRDIAKEAQRLSEIEREEQARGLRVDSNQNVPTEALKQTIKHPIHL
ncbi:MAG: hypothetical protein FWF45_00585 [Coriobacteriia bacterium]|nr:hypothetical protein [Coriobacteriia bacterium]